MNDDKVIYWASRAFTEWIERKVEGAVPLYGPTDRHGVTEWAAKIGQDAGGRYFLSLAIWDADKTSAIDIRTSTAYIEVKGRKLVANFFGQAPGSGHYEKLVEEIEELLQQALLAANRKRLLELREIGASPGDINGNFEFANVDPSTN